MKRILVFLALGLSSSILLTNCSKESKQLQLPPPEVQVNKIDRNVTGWLKITIFKGIQAVFTTMDHSGWITQGAVF